jgi:hypothetical protein
MVAAAVGAQEKLLLDESVHHAVWAAGQLVVLHPAGYKQ